MKTIKCEAMRWCNKPAVAIVWGCCECYRVAMCSDHADQAVSEDWGRATKSCEPTEIQPIDEYMEMSNGYGFEEYR